MEPDIALSHFLLVRHGMIDPSWKTPEWSPLVLHGVSFTHRVPPDTEFPLDSGPPWAVFLRATGRDAGRIRLLVRIHFQDRFGSWRWLGNTTLGKPVDFPDAGEQTRDVLYQLPSMRMGGEGVHAASIHFRNAGGAEPEAPSDDDEPPEWASDPEEMFGSDGWSFGAVTYFLVERPS